jgi:hypothetical protein
MIWIIQNAPDWMLVPVIWGSLIIGLGAFILATFLKAIPVVNIYRRPIQLVSVVLLVAGIWAKGAYEIEKEWRAKVAELEVKIAASEQRAKEINTKIVTKVVTKTKQHTVYRDKIKREIQVQKEYIDKDCKLNPTAVEMYNKAIIGDKNGTTD